MPELQKTTSLTTSWNESQKSYESKNDEIAIVAQDESSLSQFIHSFHITKSITCLRVASKGNWRQLTTMYSPHQKRGTGTI